MTKPTLYPLKHRALIAVSGNDAHQFLNNIITTDLETLPQNTLRHTALLTPQGRILFDMLICQDDKTFIIETDKNRTQDLLKRLKIYTLRQNITLTPDQRPIHATQNLSDNTILADSRFPPEMNIGRCYGPPPQSTETAPEAAYKQLRWKHGIPEGAIELPPEKALPLEARLDLNEGISFQKGCYIGQEVTARTQYRGLVKRAYAPLKIENLNDDFPTPAPITDSSGSEAGTIFDIAITQDASLGLASLRLQYLKDATTEPIAELQANGARVTPFIPERLLPLPSKN